MTNFPSSLEFASLLQYEPRGHSQIAAKSRRVCYAIKKDRFVGDKNVIDTLAERLARRLGESPLDERYEPLAPYFDSQTVLVPTPRSTPIVKGGLWPALRICNAFLSAGLGQDVLSSLRRIAPTIQSSTAESGQRPCPADHFRTTRVRHPLVSPNPSRITLVDDVVTRGSTFVGMHTRLRQAYPDAEIRHFAIVRTESYKDIDRIADVVVGSIQHDQRSGRLERTP